MEDPKCSARFVRTLFGWMVNLIKDLLGGFWGIGVFFTGARSHAPNLLTFFLTRVYTASNRSVQGL